MRIRTVLGPLAATATLLAAAAPASAYDNAAWIPMIGGNPPMVKWVYFQLPNGNQSQIIFTFQTGSGTVSNSFPIGVAIPTSLASQWMGKVDDPAPLRWYAQHVDPTWLGWRVFGWGPGPDQHTPLAPQLIAVMNREHFAPSMVGGYDVPGLTAAAATPSPTPASPAPQSATAPPSPSTAPSVPSRTVSAATPTSSAPTGTAASKPTSSASPTSRPASPATPGKVAATPSATAPSAAASTAPASAAPTGAPDTPVATAAPTRPPDPRRPPARPHGFPWPELVGAVIVAAAGGYGVWRWRQAR